MQGAVQTPVFHIYARVCFLQLANASLNTFENSILNIFHGVGHWHLQFNHFGFFATFERSSNGHVKSRPEGCFS